VVPYSQQFCAAPMYASMAAATDSPLPNVARALLSTFDSQSAPPPAVVARAERESIADGIEHMWSLPPPSVSLFAPPSPPPLRPRVATCNLRLQTSKLECHLRGQRERVAVHYRFDHLKGEQLTMGLVRRQPLGREEQLLRKQQLVPVRRGGLVGGVAFAATLPAACSDSGISTYAVASASGGGVLLADLRVRREFVWPKATYLPRGQRAAQVPTGCEPKRWQGLCPLCLLR
jgi:hypothetical protein